MKRILKNIIFSIFLLILCIILSILIAVVMTIIRELLVAPTEFLFYEQSWLGSAISVILCVLPPALFCDFLVERFLHYSANDRLSLLYWWRSIKKGKIIIIACWIMGIYCFFADVTFVTKDSVILHSPIKPNGVEYKYSQIEQIETGFGDKKFAVCHYNERGCFYYKITVNGRKIVFSSPSPNGEIERYTQDSYLELEEFDAALVKLGIPKKASEKGYEYCNFDKEYVDRFLRIINSK